jgi:hypothetical protein
MIFLLYFIKVTRPKGLYGFFIIRKAKYGGASPKFIWAPCEQLYLLAKSPLLPPPRIWAHIRAKIRGVLLNKCAGQHILKTVNKRINTCEPIFSITKKTTASVAEPRPKGRYRYRSF